MSITQVAEVTRLVKPSLACLVEMPFGLTLGAVGDDESHRRIVLRTLAEAAEDHPTGTIVDLGEVWTLDDERRRQLAVDGLDAVCAQGGAAQPAPGAGARALP